MKRYHYILIVLALICLISGSITGAISYFTTYAEARGSITLKLGEETEISEKYDGSKNLTIKNTHKDISVYIRAKAFVGEALKDTLKYEGEGWRDGGDGYWYYGDPKTKVDTILGPGKDTTPLKVSFKPPKDPKLDDSFNVVVIYESVPVIYDKNGNGDQEKSWKQPWTINGMEGGN